MTVKELIKELKKYPPDDEIRVWGTTDDNGEGSIDSSDFKWSISVNKQ